MFWRGYIYSSRENGTLYIYNIYMVPPFGEDKVLLSPLPPSFSSEEVVDRDMVLVEGALGREVGVKLVLSRFAWVTNAMYKKNKMVNII